MAIGLGIVLLVVGLILALDVVNFDSSVVDSHALGWILILGGALAIILSLVISQQRTNVGRRRRIVEQRVEEPPL
jgi:uncharacterized membrane protein HdeD (DUF308 family)